MFQSIIIIGSNPASRLALIRSVGKLENSRVKLIVLVLHEGKHNRPFDSYSKYVDSFYYAKKFDPEGLAKLLLNHLREENNKPIIMSVDDDSACMVDIIQDQLKPFFLYSHINFQAGAIAALMDKQKQKELAKQFGLNVVDSWTTTCENGKYTIPEGVRYPCFVKGNLCYHSAKQYQKRCDSRLELKEWLEVMSRSYPNPLIIEQFIDIDREYGVIGYCNQNDVIIPSIVELIDGGHGGHKGVSAFGRVNNPSLNEDITNNIKKLMRFIRLSGMFNIDFVESNGKWFFVELNFRFAAYGYAVSCSGVNLPAFQILEKNSLNFSTLNKTVVENYTYVNETIAFDDVLGGARSLKDYRILLNKADCCIINQTDDPKPYIRFKKKMVVNYLKSIIKKIVKNN